jgi:hypothetical protein
VKSVSIEMAAASVLVTCPSAAMTPALIAARCALMYPRHQLHLDRWVATAVGRFGRGSAIVPEAAGGAADGR